MDINDQQGDETKPFGTAHMLVIEGVGIVKGYGQSGYLGTTEDGRHTGYFHRRDAAEKALRDLAGVTIQLTEDELVWLVEKHSDELVRAEWWGYDDELRELESKEHTDRLRKLRDYWGESGLADAAEFPFDLDSFWFVVGRCGRWVLAYNRLYDDPEHKPADGPLIGFAFEDGLPFTWIPAAKDVLCRILTHPDWQSAKYSERGYMSPCDALSRLSETSTPTETKTTE